MHEMWWDAFLVCTWLYVVDRVVCSIVGLTFANAIQCAVLLSFCFCSTLNRDLTLHFNNKVPLDP